MGLLRRHWPVSWKIRDYPPQSIELATNQSSPIRGSCHRSKMPHLPTPPGACVLTRTGCNVAGRQDSSPATRRRPCARRWDARQHFTGRCSNRPLKNAARLARCNARGAQRPRERATGQASMKAYKSRANVMPGRVSVREARMRKRRYGAGKRRLRRSSAKAAEANTAPHRRRIQRPAHVVHLQQGYGLRCLEERPCSILRRQ